MSKILRLERVETFSHPNFPVNPLNRGDVIRVDDDFAAELLAKGRPGSGEEQEFINYFKEMAGNTAPRYDFTEEHIARVGTGRKTEARIASWRVPKTEGSAAAPTPAPAPSPAPAPAPSVDEPGAAGSAGAPTGEGSGEANDSQQPSATATRAPAPQRARPTPKRA